MRLYRHATKRLAKKLVTTDHDWKTGKVSGRRPKDWRYLNGARLLKPGDLVSTCIGFNERVRCVEPEWRYFPPRLARFAGRVVCDFAIETDRPDGTIGSCSWFHCCTYPLETKRQIIDFWLEVNERHPCALSRAVAEGVDVFTDEGELKPEYFHLWRDDSSPVEGGLTWTGN